MIQNKCNKLLVLLAELVHTQCTVNPLYTNRYKDIRLIKIYRNELNCEIFNIFYCAI